MTKNTKGTFLLILENKDKGGEGNFRFFFEIWVYFELILEMGIYIGYWGFVMSL